MDKNSIEFSHNIKANDSFSYENQFILESPMIKTSNVHSTSKN